MLNLPPPLYEQIAADLAEKIDDRTWEHGRRLPSEDDLAVSYGVSRVTINRAVSLLRAAGRVRVHRGVGTVVNAPKRRYRDPQPGPVADPATAAEPVTDPAKLINHLLGDGPIVVRHETRGSADDTLQLITAYAPAEPPPAAGGHPRVAEEITVRMPTRAERDALHLEPLEPVIAIWRMTYAVTGGRADPTEIATIVMPAHRWTLRYQQNGPQ